MRPSDRARTNDGSGLEHSKMVDLMRMMMGEKQDLVNRLEQANQKVLDLTKERDNLTNKLEQANRKIEELANQLKEARSGETSSFLQKGEASLQSDWSGNSNIRKLIKDDLAKKKKEERRNK
jgi:predicted RNase H-like nuclease (RuvC/YqgF family)